MVVMKITSTERWDNKLTLVERRGDVVGHIETQRGNDIVHFSTMVRGEGGAST